MTSYLSNEVVRKVTNEDNLIQKKMKDMIQIYNEGIEEFKRVANLVTKNQGEGDIHNQMDELEEVIKDLSMLKY